MNIERNDWFLYPAVRRKKRMKAGYCMGGSINGDIQNGWFIRENPIRIG
jgi:hypothetical protein